MTELQGGALSTQVPERAPLPSTSGAGQRGGGKRGKKRGERRSPVVKLRTLSRETVSEMRKVIYPSRQELITYVTVVLVFVSVMVAVTAGLDYVFTKGVIAVFG